MHPTLIILNGAVYTVNANNPHAEAIAITNNRITHVGDTATLKALAGPETTVIDAKGKSVLPGFIDSHFHLEWGSRTLIGAQLQGMKEMPTVTAAIQAWHAANPEADWVLGQGASYALPTPHAPLTRQLLDKIEATKPLVITAFDMHSMFVNSAALAAAGLTYGTDQQLENGTVIVDADGFATGEIYELDAMQLIYDAQPTPSKAQRKDTIKAGLALCAQHGITSVHNMDGDYAQASLYAELEEENALTLRIHVPYWVKPGMQLATVLANVERMQAKFNSNKVRSNGVKFFMDGVYESHTALSISGYPDQPAHKGDEIWDAATFAQFATAADALGAQIAVHAVGDGAVQAVLNGYETVQQTNGKRDSRHRIEHIEMLQPSDVHRFTALGVIAAMQPLHAPLSQAEENDVWPTRIWPKERPHAFPWQTLQQAGAKIAFGSDWPVVTLSTAEGIAGAVTRTPFAPGATEQALPLADTIAAYTTNGAYAEFQETQKGQLSVGMLADVVILSDNIFEISPDRLAAVTIDLTICDGDIVYRKDL